MMMMEYYFVERLGEWHKIHLVALSDYCASIVLVLQMRSLYITFLRPGKTSCCETIECFQSQLKMDGILEAPGDNYGRHH